jgi:unsaturated rhamnogalacturonyl hydrolase
MPGISLGSVPFMSHSPVEKSTRDAPSPESFHGDWFAELPGGAPPGEFGRCLARDFLKAELWSTEAPFVHYSHACAWYGALAVARALGDRVLLQALIEKFDPLLGSQSGVVPSRGHVDDRVFGIVPLEISIACGAHRHLRLGLELADAQWASSTDGITSEARFWVDDMYMITALQVQAYRATGDAKYLDRAARTMVRYLERLQGTDGLFVHTKTSPVLWSRGNGWAAAGLTELLLALPEGHEARAAVERGYTKMMAELVRHQDERGTWRQILDDANAWPETSGSAMFTFALASGVVSGWLDGATFGSAARTAWLGVLGHLDDDGALRDVCVGTGEAFSVVGPEQSAQQKYYFDRPRKTGDMHGQAPLLWTMMTLLRTVSSEGTSR